MFGKYPPTIQNLLPFGAYVNYTVPEALRESKLSVKAYPGIYVFQTAVGFLVILLHENILLSTFHTINPKFIALQAPTELLKSFGLCRMKMKNKCWTPPKMRKIMLTTTLKKKNHLMSKKKLKT